MANILTSSWPGVQVLLIKTRKRDNNGVDSGRHFKDQGRDMLEAVVILGGVKAQSRKARASEQDRLGLNPKVGSEVLCDPEEAS